MAKLVNKKTGKEVSASDPDKVMKRFPKAFRQKPATKLNNEVAKKEADIKSKSIDVKDAQEVNKEKQTPEKGA